MRIIIPILYLFFALLLPSTATAASPAVLIPGDGASALEIQYKDMSPPHWWCSKSSGDLWERLWIPNLSELLPKNIDCWSHKMMLLYNETDVRNSPGVLGIRAIEGAKGLNTFGNKPSDYQALVDALPNLHVATYDFRLSPRGNPQFMKQLKELVESAYSQGDQKVTLISHSLGGLMVHYFLTVIVTEEWKQTYIQGWIPMAPAYGGTKYTLKQLISGDSVSIPWLQGKDVKEQQRSYETSVWLLPHPNLYDGVIVSTNKRNYTIHEYRELFRDAGFQSYPIQWERVKKLTLWNTTDNHRQLADPTVTVYPVYGIDVETVEGLVYDESALDREPTELKSTLGDGTINLKSLQAGNHWALAQTPLELEGVSHVGLLSDSRAVQYIRGIVFGDARPEEAR